MRTLTRHIGRQLYRFMVHWSISPNVLIFLVVTGVVVAYWFAV